jgi:hypothetical protein
MGNMKLLVYCDVSLSLSLLRRWWSYRQTLTFQVEGMLESGIEIEIKRSRLKSRNDDREVGVCTSVDLSIDFLILNSNSSPRGMMMKLD